MHYPEGPIAIVDHLVLTPNTRGYGAFFSFCDLIAGYLEQRRIAFDHVVAEVMLSERQIASNLKPRLHALEIAKSLVAKYSDPRPAGAGVFHLWNRYNCQLAVQFVEYRQELSLRDLAIFQGGQRDNEPEPFPLRVRQILCALALNSGFGVEVAEAPPEEAYKVIVKQLMNLAHPERDDFLQALVAQWRIGVRAVFLQNVMNNLKTIVSISTDNSWQILAWAYQEAKGLARETDSIVLKKALLESPNAAEKLSELDKTSMVNRLEHDLSPMGRLALRSANWDLDHAMKDSRMWRDAGMISLGFFRIL